MKKDNPQSPLDKPIDEILAEPREGECKTIPACSIDTCSDPLYTCGCLDCHGKPAEPPRPEKATNFMQVGKTIKCGHCSPDFAQVMPCECVCHTAPLHKEEDWAIEFDSISPIGNKDDSGYVKDWIRTKKSEWEAAAEKKGYEQGFKKNAELLFNEICESSNARAEAVREERERVQPLIMSTLEEMLPLASNRKYQKCAEIAVDCFKKIYALLEPKPDNQ